MITAPPTKQAPIEIRWVAVWIFSRVSGLSRECSGATALSPTGSQTGAATTTITKISSRACVHHGAADGAGALGDAQIQRQSREVGEHSEQPGGQQLPTAGRQRLVLVARRCAATVRCRRLRATCQAP